MKSISKVKKITVITVLPVIAFFMMSLVINQGDGVPEKYKNMKNPVKSEKESIASGKELYTKNCKMCHGAEGKGGKMAGKSDFTSKEFKAFTDGEIFYYTTEGFGKMPAYKNKIKGDNDRWNLVNYMRSL
ncbi:MAG: cytochrome c [Bacteroidales bacterium]|jgi:cytochrome c5